MIKKLSVLLLLLTACTTETVLEVGDGTQEGCTFIVQDQICLTETLIRRCAGNLELYVVSP